MKEFQQYVEGLLYQLDAPKREKAELALEFYDHLLLLKNEHMDKGHSEKESVQLAI